MSPSLAHLGLLLVQILFAFLPGDGIALCLGGAHGAVALCGDHADEPHAGSQAGPQSAARGASQGDGGRVADHGPRQACDDCHGVHLTRGALETWLTTGAPERPESAAVAAALPVSPPWLAASLRDEDVGDRRGAVPRRAPPPSARALAVVRATELRI